MEVVIVDSDNVRTIIKDVVEVNYLDNLEMAVRVFNRKGFAGKWDIRDVHEIVITEEGR